MAAVQSTRTAASPGPPDPAGEAIARVHGRFAALPYMTDKQAQRLQRLLHEHQLRNCLELGFFHGKSAAYTAAIVKPMGGHLVAIDRLSAKALKPNIEEVLQELDLLDTVDFYYEEVSYNWRLMEMLERTPRPVFDFCYIDGGHTWERDGFAFCLAEKMLRSGGWILFDDIDHSFQKSYAGRGLIEPGGGVPKGAGLTQLEFSTQQIRKVWDLLVREHPGFHNFTEEGRWGFAQKR